MEVVIVIVRSAWISPRPILVRVANQGREDVLRAGLHTQEQGSSKLDCFLINTNFCMLVLQIIILLLYDLISSLADATKGKLASNRQ